MKHPTRPCPVCSGYDREVLHEQRFYDGVLGDGYDVVVCRHCGTGFADGIPDQAELNRYYADQSKYTYASSGGRESPYDISRFENIVDQVAPFISKSARILDVGCATGGLLSVFKRRGYANVLGADPSPACAEAARVLYDIEVRSSTVFDLDTWVEQFDVVMFVGVLEHVREVQEAIRALRSRVRVGSGLLYIAVPDLTGFSRCRNAPFQQFSMEHINFFTGVSLANAAATVALTPAVMKFFTVEWRESIMEPIVGALFRQTEGTHMALDALSKGSIDEYVRHSIAKERELVCFIDNFVATGVSYYIWGCGALTRRLLLISDLAHGNLKGFIANDSAAPDLLAGFPVLRPSDIRDHSSTVVIASIAFEAEIAHQIKTTLAWSNPLLKIGSFALGNDKPDYNHDIQ